MNPKKLLILAAAAAILAGFAAWSGAGRRIRTPSLIGKSVLPGLDLAAVRAIEIGRVGGPQTVLASADAGWRIESLHGYPADITKIRERLIALKDLKVGQMARGAAMADPVVVALKGDNGKALAEIRLGATHRRQAADENPYGGGYPDGRFVAAGTDGPAVLVTDSLEAFDAGPTDWADTQIASVPAADLVSITISRGGKADVTLTQKNGAWTVAGLGTNEAFGASENYGVENALGSLHFTSVADPELPPDVLGLTTGTTYRAVLKDGESYAATIGNAVTNGTDRYVRLAASFAPTGTNTMVNAMSAAKVKDFNAKAGKWIYIVAAADAKDLTKTRTDLVKPKAESKPAKEVKKTAK